MAKQEVIDWSTTADILDNATDEEIDEALRKLDPFPGQTAGEAVSEALEIFKKMGIMPDDDDEQ